jgi:hypothetical protein
MFMFSRTSSSQNYGNPLAVGDKAGGLAMQSSTWSCKLFSQLQNLSMNKRYQNKELMPKYLEDKREALELLEFAISVCLLCQELGIKFVIEHPFTATSWQTPAMQKLLRNPLFHFSRADQCEYGLRWSQLLVSHFSNT